MREGRELQGFVQSGGLARRLALLARLARVLASLHGLGIAHGDLSPRNVFVSSTHAHSQVWLIDVDIQILTLDVRDQPEAITRESAADDCSWPKPGLATCERITARLTFGSAPWASGLGQAVNWWGSSAVGQARSATAPTAAGCERSVNPPILTDWYSKELTVEICHRPILKLKT